MPFKGSAARHSQLNANNRPNLVEAFFAKRELPLGHPTVTPGCLPPAEPMAGQLARLQRDGAEL